MSLEQLRKEREERYRKYLAEHPEARPKVTICPYCNEPTYREELCPETGKYHNLENKKVIGASVVANKVIKSSELMEAIDRTRVKWVPSRTSLVKADAQSLNIFQSYVASRNWNLQRYGILYGMYDTSSKVIEVHAVYEPEQVGSPYSFMEQNDPRIKKVDAIAILLGLRRVGVVCTHPARNSDEIVLNCREMLLCAKEQSRFGDECVLLTIAPNLLDGGQVECQAWQVSPQCVQLYRLNLLHEPTITSTAGKQQDALLSASSEEQNVTKSNNKPINNCNVNANGNNNNNINNGSGSSYGSSNNNVVICDNNDAILSDVHKSRYVHASIELEVAQEVNDSKGHAQIITKTPSTEIDTRWFTSYIAVQHFDSPIVRGLFMRISRPGMSPPTFSNLKAYMYHPKRAQDNFAEKLADFHVLIFLAEMFSMIDDIPILVNIAKEKVMSDKAKEYEALLKEYMQEQGGY